MSNEMTSMERVLCALSHKEADRVPLFLLFSHYGAKELDLPIQKYFSSVDSVVKAQTLLRQKFNTDCYYTFSYAAREVEAWGGEVLFQDEAPPNAGEPIIKSPDDIASLKIPEIREIRGLTKVLEITDKLSSVSRGEVPVIGVVMSPFALPVMQMGFEKYLELLYWDKDKFRQLMKINQQFCINWANAQIQAGADAICYFNPLGSTEIIEEALYNQTGMHIDRDTINRIQGPVAFHLASGMAGPSLDVVNQTESSLIGISSRDDLYDLKRLSQGKISLLGNLNGIEMVQWDSEQAEKNVKDILKTAGSGGGLILSDNHGEIPWQVHEKTLEAVSKANLEWGTYPLKKELFR